ncbi:MAG: hypothetical protein EA379_07440 [Phycisphaerales bacterium]|nr:MAG: hypothetical protein EA379_07440 [Phycisphaerales bacterium]
MLLAAQELGRAGLDALPSSVMGAPSQPRALCDFTVYEVFEAELFLLRCGLLKLPRQRPTGV